MNAIDQAIVDILMPDRPEQASAYRAQVIAQEQRERDLISEVTIECIDAIADISAAMRYPRVGADDIEAAIVHLQDALKAVRKLDQ